jgi:hypothetical protein
VEIPWTFFRKAALVLFGISLLAGVGSTALHMGDRLPVETWRVVFILALVVLTISSTILVPGVLLPNIIWRYRNRFQRWLSAVEESGEGDRTGIAMRSLPRLSFPTINLRWKRAPNRSPSEPANVRPACRYNR